VFEAGYSPSPGGTGFGLKIVDRIADGHDWDVSVTEGTEGGARFEFTEVDVVSEE
jgi:signal transduction histidine kinase